MAKKRANSEGAVYRRKDGLWAGAIDLGYGNGRRQRRVFYGKTQAEAIRKLREAQRLRDYGLPLGGERLTVVQLLRQWLNESAEPALRPRTFLSYQMIVERHLIPQLGRTSLAKLSPQQVQSYMNAKLAEGLSARTVQYHHAVLRRALGQAERWGLVARNVAKLVTPPRVQRAEVRPLNLDEARSLLKVTKGERLEPLFSLALGLGLRQGELLGLTWDDVDLKSQKLTVRRTLQRHGGAFHLSEPKTNRSRRTILLPAPLVESLRSHRARQLEERLRAGSLWNDGWNLVFASEVGEPLTGFHVGRQFKRLLKLAGLRDQRFHDLRHASATFMLAQGVPLRVVMDVLGHSQIHVTANTYSHVMPEMQRDATERVGKLLWA
jgi:integrase